MMLNTMIGLMTLGILVRTKIIGLYLSLQFTLTARLPNPLMSQSMRPCVEADDREEELTFFVPAVPSVAGQNLITPLSCQGLVCQLELDIASLVFSHHHLFSLEHYMTR